VPVPWTEKSEDPPGTAPRGPRLRSWPRVRAPDSYPKIRIPTVPKGQDTNTSAWSCAWRIEDAARRGSGQRMTPDILATSHGANARADLGIRPMVKGCRNSMLGVFSAQHCHGTEPGRRAVLLFGSINSLRPSRLSRIRALQRATPGKMTQGTPYLWRESKFWC